MVIVGDSLVMLLTCDQATNIAYVSKYIGSCAYFENLYTGADIEPYCFDMELLHDDLFIDSKVVGILFSIFEDFHAMFKGEIIELWGYFLLSLYASIKNLGDFICSIQHLLLLIDDIAFPCNEYEIIF